MISEEGGSKNSIVVVTEGAALLEILLSDAVVRLTHSSGSCES